MNEREKNEAAEGDVLRTLLPRLGVEKICRSRSCGAAQGDVGNRAATDAHRPGKFDMVQVKICGIQIWKTRWQPLAAGAHALGFNLYRQKLTQVPAHLEAINETLRD